MKKLTGIAAYILIVSCALFGTGCNTAGYGPDVRYFVTIHEIVSTSERHQYSGNSFVRKVTSPAGAEYDIRHIPLLSSNQLKSAERIEEKEGNRLVFQLDKHGGMIWYQGCIELQGRAAAILVDGECRHIFRLPKLYERPTYFEPDVDWESWEADKVIEWAELNYTAMQKH